MGNTNIQTFDRCVASVLSTLLEYFPIPAHLDFSDLAIQLWDEGDDEEAHFDKHEVYSCTVAWLHRAGYIWANKLDNWEAFGVLLSPQGLELLKMPVSLEQPGPTFGEEIGDAMKQGAREKAAELVNKALTLGIRLVTSLP